jgi:hypothetical protein
LFRVFVFALVGASQLFGDACKLDFQVTSPIGERVQRFEARLSNLGTLKDYRFHSRPALVPCGFYQVSIGAPGFVWFHYATDLYSSGTLHAPLKIASIGGTDIEGRMIRISLEGARARRVKQMILLSAEGSMLASYFLDDERPMRVVAPRGDLLFICLDGEGEVVKAGKVKVRKDEPGEGIIDLN